MYIKLFSSVTNCNGGSFVVMEVHFIIYLILCGSSYVYTKQNLKNTLTHLPWVS